MTKNKKGFALFELLLAIIAIPSSIVMLAIILVIIIPQKAKTIDESRSTALESSAKLIASSAEREYLVRNTLGYNEFEKFTPISCEEIIETTEDYSSCIIIFDEEGKAYVTLVGRGKFAGKYVCNATRTNASVSETSCIE